MSSLRVFASGQNLLTLTQLKAVDPEGPGEGGNSARGWFYPQLKVVAFGMNLTF
jgi:hypothetical protein